MLVDGVDEDGVACRPHVSRSTRDRRRRATRRRRGALRPTRRLRSRDSVRCRRPGSRGEGRRLSAGANAAAAPRRSAKRFGHSALATPANFVTLVRIIVAIPTLALIRSDGIELADRRAVVRDHGERQPRRLAGAARRRDAIGRVPRSRRRQADRARRTRRARRPRRVPVVARVADRGTRVRYLVLPVDRRPARDRAACAALRQVQGVHAVLRRRLRAAAVDRRRRRASSRSCSRSRWCSRSFPGSQIVRRGYIDWTPADSAAGTERATT